MLLLTLVLGVIASCFATEVMAWLPLLADRLLRYHASHLPPSLGERLLDEWRSDIASLPGALARVGFALDLFRCVPELRHTHLYPDLDFRPATRAANRLLDILVASACFAVSAVTLLWLTALVRLTSAGPAFYTHTYCGLHGKRIGVLKFRTQFHEGERRGEVTPVGRFLKAFSFDELLLMLSVLRGDMAIVGPSPNTPGKAAKFTETERHLLSVKPGLLAPSALCPPAEPGQPGAVSAVEVDLAYVMSGARRPSVNVRIIALALKGVLCEAVRKVRHLLPPRGGAGPDSSGPADVQRGG